MISREAWLQLIAAETESEKVERLENEVKRTRSDFAQAWEAVMEDPSSQNQSHLESVLEQRVNADYEYQEFWGTRPGINLSQQGEREYDRVYSSVFKTQEELDSAIQALLSAALHAAEVRKRMKSV